MASAAAFLAILRQTQLLSAAQIDQLSRSPSARDADSRPLARDVMERGWLTTFQINQLIQGGPLAWGPYQLLDRLGEGYLGKVYKARHTTTQQLAAVKILHKERLDPGKVAVVLGDFQQLQQARHPNIATVLSVMHSGDSVAVVSELVEGTDLGKLSRGNPLPALVACDYLRQATLGLQFIHGRGWGHRGIKPTNLILARTPSGETVKITDLGLGWLHPPTDLATAECLAPEQAKNPLDGDHRADLYSLGAVFHFLLTGQPPFPAPTGDRMLLRHQREEVQPLARVRNDVPAAIESILRKLLAKRPEDRYQTANDLLVALKPYAGAASTPTRPAPVQRPVATAGPAALRSARPQDRVRKSRKVAVTIAAVVLVFLGAAAGIYFSNLNPLNRDSTMPEIAQLETKVEVAPSTQTEPPSKTPEVPKGELKAEPAPTEPTPKAEPKVEPTPKVEPKTEPTPKTEPKPEPKEEPKATDPKEVQTLIIQLKDMDESVRLKAAKRLEKLGAAALDAVAALTEALKDPDEDVRTVAQRALDGLKDAIKREEIASLIRQLKDKDEIVRLQAAKKLGDLGAAAADAIPALTEATKDKDPDVQRVAKKSLEVIQVAAKGGDPGLYSIAKGLKAIQQADRVKAAQSLAKLGPKGKEASAVVIESMLERWPNNKEEFLDALAAINPTLQKPVVTLLVDQNALSKQKAIHELEDLKGEAKPAVPILLALVQAELQRSSTKNYLGLGGEALVTAAHVDPQNNTVIQTVLGLVPHNTRLGRGRVDDTHAIELAFEMKIDPKLLAPPLITAMANPQVKLMAVRALGKIGPEAKAAIPALNKMRFDSVQQVREAATEALKSIQSTP